MMTTMEDLAGRDRTMEIIDKKGNIAKESA